MKIINEESARFLQMDKGHSESNVTRTYLDYLTSMPFGVRTLDNFDLKKAEAVLDSTHYGMKEVKERIKEFVAVGKLKSSVQGKILCFLGPPGVGKTSIGKSIADSIGRKFVRIAMGGDRDTSALKGFRRTYVGAVPGKIVRALRTAEVENPVILMDEVDKLGMRSQQGDPGSVLLEILDPEQNKEFTDDFLDAPIDLSKVLFICTANSLEGLHPALLDRMEIIHVSGYTFEEKRHILDAHLLPQALEAAGLQKGVHDFEINPKALDAIVKDYCREPGVRSLKKTINKIAEKIAYRVVQGNKTHVDEHLLKDLIGHPLFSPRTFYGNNIPPASW